MAFISETKFAEICEGIFEDRKIIIRHNPIGTDREILLWMLLSCLVTYLSLEDIETPCFTGRPDETAYRNAIDHILKNRRTDDFDPAPAIGRMLAE